MERMDANMPFLLQYENVAWYSEGNVRILDRRVYPSEIRFVDCKSHCEVAQAIADMVTQSAGPYTAVGMGMALAAYECRDIKEAARIAYLEEASRTLSHSRPTTANRYGIITERCVEVAKAAFTTGEDPVERIVENVIESLNRRYSTMQIIGDSLVDLIPENGKILTQCYGETVIGAMIRASINKNKNFKVMCAETRPYLQGARLTASCFASMGFDVTVITDNMVAYSMQHEGIDLFTSAADSIARSGHIANKIGTFQIALLANHFGISYFVTGIPDKDKYSDKDIVIEMRDPDQVLACGGVKNTLPGVKAIYPSFDIVSPELISGVVTDRGLFDPYALDLYFEEAAKDFY